MTESETKSMEVEAPATARVAVSDRVLDLVLSALHSIRRLLDAAIARLESWRGRRFRPTILAAMLGVALAALPLTCVRNWMDLERLRVAQERQRMEFELVFAEARVKSVTDAQKRGLFTAAGVAEARARVAKLQVRLKELGSP